MPYDDYSVEIAQNFDPPRPVNRTNLADIQAIISMFDGLNTTVLKVEMVTLFSTCHIKFNPD
jgi:hypothetical protein